MKNDSFREPKVVARTLTLDGVSFSFHAKDRNKKTPEFEVLGGIDLCCKRGEVTVLVGPSGCGKTTLLNIMAGLLVPSRGVIDYFGAPDIDGVGYVFQTASLIPWRTIWDNVLFGTEIKGKVGDEIDDRARRLLEIYGLYEFRRAYPASLSGGMQQRVSLARAVITGAPILLLDEPFSNSDYVLRRDLQRDVSQAVNTEDIAAVLVTHDLEEAILMGDSLVVLTARPARVKAEIRIPVKRDERLKGSRWFRADLAPYLDQLVCALEAD